MARRELMTESQLEIRQPLQMNCCQLWRRKLVINELGFQCSACLLSKNDAVNAGQTRIISIAKLLFKNSLKFKMKQPNEEYRSAVSFAISNLLFHILEF